MKKIRVLIVDDSLLIRSLFSEILGSDEDIEVVATATDPIDARQKIKSLNPDVVTLDIEMPKMDGITFLEKIMTLRPTPVVMVSSLTKQGTEATIRALELGAVDFIPKINSSEFDADKMGKVLIHKVKVAAKIKVHSLKRERELLTIENHPIQKIIKTLANKKITKEIIAVGSSTGGVEAIKEIVSILPNFIPPIIITQHMPRKFTRSFADRMDSISNLSICEAQNGMKLRNGHAYIAPGDYHLKLTNKCGEYIINIDDGEKVTGHRPSVDVMFQSVANVVSTGKIIGIILTGMGKDGTKGMMELKNKKAVTIGQDESSSIVYGMPKAAYLAGAVDEQISLNKIAERILQLCT